MSVESERARRTALWEQLRTTSPENMTAALLRQLRVYGGAQGIWVDTQLTSTVSPEARGITVSILHTGVHYPDDLSESGLLYHYPDTNRSAGRDRSEIEATKAACQLGLPIFVILSEESDDRLRQVRLGWVADWDDESKQFLVLFGESQPQLEPSPSGDQPFKLHDDGGRRTVMTKARLGQQKFRFQVLKQYGAKCCVCSISVPELLAAAHICGKEHRGSDDWRNGIPLCHTHHSAFDSGFFAVNPSTFGIEVREGYSTVTLGLTEAILSPLRQYPHPEALDWRYQKRRIASTESDQPGNDSPNRDSALQSE